MPRKKKYTGQAKAVVEKFVEKSEKRLEAVAKQSFQDLVRQVNLPVAKGGRMRVDTGFLRASGQASLTGMPTGPSRKPTSTEPQTYDDGTPVPDTVILTIAKFKLGGRFWFGWTANYARYREAHDAFLRLGVQNWQKIVDNNVRILKERIK